MPNICKTDLYPLTDLNHLIVLTGNDPADDIIRILHGIKRLYECIVCTSLRLTVLPLRILHLDMCTVTQHNATQIRRSIRGIDLSSEASGIQKRQKTRMIHMGMGQQHIIHLRLAHRKLCILKGINALLHTIIHQNMFLSDL